MKKTVCKFLAVVMLLLTVGACTGERTGTATNSASVGGEPRIMRILLLGCDRAASLTDSIMLLTVDRTAGRASVLQIPRDTYAEYTSQSYKKLNGAAGALGMEQCKRFLEEVLGVGIDCYLSLRSDSIAQIVDAVGGVDVDVPQDMVYSDPEQGLEIHLRAGQSHLSGDEAEQFVRYRAGYVNADLGRLDAQKLFLRAFARRCQSLTPSQSVSVAIKLLRAVKTDLPIQDAVALIGVLRACSAEDTVMQTLPGVAVQGESGAWYYAVNRAGAVRVIGECLMAPDASFDPRGVLDREENALFHEIYTAAEEELPALAERAQKQKQ